MRNRPDLTMTHPALRDPGVIAGYGRQREVADFLRRQSLVELWVHDKEAAWERFERELRRLSR